MTRKTEGLSAENAGPITTMENEQGGKSSGQTAPSPSPSTPLKKQRIAGLNRGTIKLSEDFDEPLPDEFWLGIE